MKGTTHGAAVALLALSAGPAAAHVTLERAEATTGRSYKAVFKVPHGCDGAATTRIRVDIPEGVIGVKPMPKPGWTIDIATGAYARDYAFHHGAKLSEGVKQVTWSGGPLPDAYYDEFVFNAFIAREIGGGAIYFPVRQTCETGEIGWTEVPKEDQDPHALEAPAPVLRLVADDHNGAPAAGVTARPDGLAIQSAWARATPEGAKVGAGYLTITNSGSVGDVLTQVSTPVAERVEIHETTTTAEGVSKMRPVEGGLEIKAGATVALKPGGMHLMLMGLKAPLKEDERVSATLTFKAAGDVTVELEVAPVGAGGPSQHHHHEH